MGLIQTKINDILQDMHLIRHLIRPEYFATANHLLLLIT